MKKTILFLFILFLTGCSASQKDGEKVLLFAGYSAVREVMKEVVPEFEKEWFEKTGEKLSIKQSYASSGTQSRAIAAGFEADVALLAIEPDVERLVQEKLITHDWKRTWGGTVAESAVVFAVRKGNPKKIKNWGDLLQNKLEVLMPNPKTSGGAQWIVFSAYGAALKGNVNGYAASPEGGKRFLADLITRVTVMDKGARESMINFEFGAGDVAINYESEVLTGIRKGGAYETVLPDSSVIVENPVAVVDLYAEKHNVKKEAEAFVDFLFSEKAQLIFARNGYRPIRPEVLNRFNESLRYINDFWSLSYLGNWLELNPEFFGSGGIYTRAVKEVRNR